MLPFVVPWQKLSFAYPQAFLLVLFLWPLYWYRFHGKRRPTIRFSVASAIRQAPFSWRQWAPFGFFILEALVLTFLAAAAARPRLGNSVSQHRSEGLDMMLVIDTSGSMRALDLKLGDNRYDRLTVVKNVVLEFVKKRTDDRIGMVVFGSEAFTQAPLTLDHDVLINFLSSLEIEMAGPATAIGDAIATASRRLKDIESKSKIIILLTDGENTAGTTNPLEAAKAAHTFGIKIYAIGVGSNGSAPFPVQGFFGNVRMVNQPVKIDTKMLADIASATGGQSFLASDTEALRKVYDTINRLEKTEVEVQEFMNYEEVGHYFLWPVVFGIMLLGILAGSPLRSLP